MKVDYLITNGEKNFFQILQKTQVLGIQNKTNNIKIDSENKSIFVIKRKHKTQRHFFCNKTLKINISNKT